MELIKSLDFVTVKDEKDVNESPYDPEFVAKIKESRQQAKEGKTIKMDLDDIWKE